MRASLSALDSVILDYLLMALPTPWRLPAHCAVTLQTAFLTLRGEHAAADGTESEQVWRRRALWPMILMLVCSTTRRGAESMLLCTRGPFAISVSSCAMQARLYICLKPVPCKTNHTFAQKQLKLCGSRAGGCPPCGMGSCFHGSQHHDPTQPQPGRRATCCGHDQRAF